MTHTFHVDEVVDFEDDFTESTDSIYQRFKVAERKHNHRAQQLRTHTHSDWRVSPTGYVQHAAHVVDYHVQKAGEARAFQTFLVNTGKLNRWWIKR